MGKSATPSSFGILLRKIREDKGLTQIELGELTGMPQAMITRLETSPKANPTIATVKRLATALGCKPSELIDDQ